MKELAIIIVVYNNANLILRQIQCIRHFCKDTYDVIVIDNSDKDGYSDNIRYYAETNDCIYKKTKASDSNSSEGHVFACNLSYVLFRDTYRYFFYLDHDNFPVKPFSVKEILSGKLMAGLGQLKPSGKKYFWPGCLMWDNTIIDTSLIDFGTNQEYGLDTGGNLYRFVERYGEEQCCFFNEEHEQNPYFRKSSYDFYSMINNGMFMHFINSSNWNPMENHEERMNSLLNVLTDKTGNIS